MRRQSAAGLDPRAGVSSTHALVLPADAEVTALALDLGRMIEAARQQVAHAANAALTTLYWQLGERIRTEVLEGRRAAYGAQIVAGLGRQLEERHGRGFGEKNLRRMVHEPLARRAAAELAEAVEDAKPTPLVGPNVPDQDRLRPTALVRDLGEFLTFLEQVRALAPHRETPPRPPTTGDHCLL